jgi:hypothetical protein
MGISYMYGRRGLLMFRGGFAAREGDVVDIAGERGHPITKAR